MLKFGLRSRLLAVLPGIIFLWASTGVAYAGPLDILAQPLDTVTTTVNSLDLPVQLGSSASGLPTLAPIDPNPAINQTVNQVNALPLPVDLPQVTLPQLPVIPGINAEQIVDNTVTDINNTVPLPVAVPNPITLLLAPGPTTPPLPGPDLIDLLTGRSGLSDPPPPIDPLKTINDFLAQANRLPDGTVTPDQRTAVGAAIILSARLDASIVAANLRKSDLMKPAPAGASDSRYDFSGVNTSLALPFLGLLCAIMAMLAYLRSGQHLWRARA